MMHPPCNASDRRLRLASASPRRRLLLPLLGFPVNVTPAESDERPLEGEDPLQTALRLADEKARRSGRPRAGEVVVGADTVVVLDGRQLGKPRHSVEAHSMLRELRSRPHEVITAVALMAPRRQRQAGAIRTTVQMRDYSDEEIERYVNSGGPLDKAGAYAIQDQDFAPVERLEGCYLNVVGLPLCEVSRGLRALGWPLADETYESPCRWCEVGRKLLDQ
jgi:MAF protein